MFASWSEVCSRRRPPRILSGWFVPTPSQSKCTFFANAAGSASRPL